MPNRKFRTLLKWGRVIGGIVASVIVIVFAILYFTGELNDTAPTSPTPAPSVTRPSDGFSGPHEETPPATSEAQIPPPEAWQNLCNRTDCFDPESESTTPTP